MGRATEKGSRGLAVLLLLLQTLPARAVSVDPICTSEPYPYTAPGDDFTPRCEFGAGGHGTFSVPSDPSRGVTTLHHVELYGGVQPLPFLKVRADVDFQLATPDPASSVVTTLAFVEVLYAEVIVGRKHRHRLRLGVEAPSQGLEGWDEWENPLPSWSIAFQRASVGRVLGGTAESSLSTGHDITLFAGQDLDHDRAWVIGAGLQVERRAWGTWAGLSLYPDTSADRDPLTPPEPALALARAGLEIYPLDLLTLGAEVTGGGGESGWFGGGQLVLELLPRLFVRPVVRAELLVDHDEVLVGFPRSSFLGDAAGGWDPGDPPRFAWSGGLAVVPVPWLRIEGEARYLASARDSEWVFVAGVGGYWRPRVIREASKQTWRKEWR